MAYSECFNPDSLVQSAHYAEIMDGVVLPYLATRRADATVRGDGDRSLFCSRFDAEQPRGTVMIVHGFTENVDKYAEIIYSLLKNGFSVCAYDQRGHGRSWRDEDIQDLSLTHVDRFDEYVRDLECVCERVLQAMPKPWLLFAHSMGGAVSSLFLERHGDVFERAALCAPMIAPNRSGLPYLAGLLLCRGAKLAGKGKARLFASRPFSGPEDFETSCATGRERFEWYDAIRVATKAFQNNGPTYAWTLESLRVTQALLRPGAVERIAVPVRVYTAENDTSVLPGPQKMFADRLKRGARVVVRGAKHEIYRSDDAVLFPWWHGVLGFLKGENG